MGVAEVIGVNIIAVLLDNISLDHGHDVNSQRLFADDYKSSSEYLVSQ